MDTTTAAISAGTATVCSTTSTWQEVEIVPVRGRPFQKGRSGNPSGRPKRDRHVAEMARAYTAEALETAVEIMRDPRAGHSVRLSAAKEVLDRAFGRAPQSLAIDQQVSFTEQFETFIRELGS